MKIKLTENNIPDYLKDIDILSGIQVSKVEEIKEHTNVNFVFKVTADNSIFYIKQAFPYVKIMPDFPAPIERQEFEYKALKYFEKEYIWEDRIPKVIHYDKDNNVLVLSDVGQNANLIAREVNAGKLHLPCASDLGLLLSELQSKTYKSDNLPIRDEKANKEHIDFIMDFRLRGAMETSPEETKKLFHDSLKVTSSLLFGDWPHKNLYITKDEKLKIIDFENVVRFDPAADIGYALADWILEIDKSNFKGIQNFIKEFVESYSSNFKYPEDLPQILERSTRYLGAMMLHRLVGTKNTNKKEEYLKRSVDLVGVGKRLLETKNVELQDCLKQTDI